MKHKILYVIANLSYGGGEKVFAQLIRGLNREQYEVWVACLPEGKFIEEIQDTKTHLEPIDLSNRYNPKTTLRLSNMIKKNDIQIVHTQGSRGNFFGRFAAHFAKVPIIISSLALLITRDSHSDVNKLKRKVYIQFDKFTSTYVDCFLVLSEFHREALISDYKIEPCRITKVYNGIELDEFESGNGYPIMEEFNVSSSNPLIGIIGRLVFEKGLPFLLQAIPKVTEIFPDARFLIVGDGPLRTELEDLVSRLNIYENCIFTGFRRDIPDILSAIDMLVMSSLYEGMPMVILEAMAASRPIIATNVGGIPELVKDGETGILVLPKDVDALAESIIHLLKSKEKAKQMGLAGRKRVEEHFDVNVMVRKTEEVYQELIQEKLGRKQIPE